MGCQSLPEAEPTASDARANSVEEVQAAPELNIPETVAESTCNCDEFVVEPEETYFDRAVRALAARDFTQALRYFEAHAESDEPDAARESEIGLAFIAVLRADRRDASNSQALDDRAEVMVLALSLLTRLEGRVAELGKLNSRLASDLKKREAVLERLRELTLGQLED